MQLLRKFTIDWVLICATLAIGATGLVTMNSFSGQSAFFSRQLIWIPLACGVCFLFSFFDFRFLRRTSVVVTLYIAILILFGVTFLVGETINGAVRWVSLGPISFQVSDFAKIVLIIVLAKYFSRRHIEIAHFKHIFISGLYAFLFFLLVFLQPDLGSAIILFLIWAGMVVISGISKKHIILVFCIAAVVFGGLWMSVFQDYQKERILTFLHPLADIQGAGYNAYQSTIAVGSGKLMGKGIGFGTQSKLQFLPEYETDFIFASFAEEWGLVGTIYLFSLFGIVIWRIIANARMGASNFERLYGAGIALFLLIHFTVHVGMNIGSLPVTGTTLPFMSYGGSHLLTEFSALGILMGMRRYAEPVESMRVQESMLA